MTQAPDTFSATCATREGDDQRKSAAAAQAAGSPAGVVRIEDFDSARQLLRGGGLRQAGFMAELIERFTAGAHAPVLFQDGESHQKQRVATARFFTPKVVTTRYRALMEAVSDRLVADFCAAGRAELDALSMEMAVAVAAEIVGLTESSWAGLADRMNRFFGISTSRTDWLSAFLGFVVGQYRLFVFYIRDVRPAIRARQRERREDVISHLLDEGYSNREILTECATYGAAGMATTREFIVMAAWHLFERDDLRRRFLDGGETGRLAILEEVLRLEPVVGTLFRRAQHALTLEAKGGSVKTIPAGAMVAIDIRAANTDPAVAGGCPFHLDAERDVRADTASASLLSFGDGPHRCPGAAVALQETAIFLERLLRVPNIRLARAPTIGWNAVVTSYELRGALIEIG